MLGTRWRHQGRSPGVALDCVGLIVCSARMIGWADIPDRTDYDARPTGGRLLEIVESCCTPARIASRGAILLLWMQDKEHPQHMGIATGDGTIIHSWATARKVVEDALNPRWSPQIHSVWRPRWRRSG